MNHILVSGHLVDKVRVTYTQDGKISAFGKIGVYNGKDKEGNQRDSMFFDIVVSGRDAEILRDNTTKGTPIIVSGRLEEDKSVSQTNGQTYINKRIICSSATPCVKPVVQQAQPQYQQAPVQQVYTQPMQQAPVQQYQAVAPQQGYTQPVQQPGSPW
jgi:single-stranded DNA-binding protein